MIFSTFFGSPNLFVLLYLTYRKNKQSEEEKVESNKEQKPLKSAKRQKRHTSVSCDIKEPKKLPPQPHQEIQPIQPTAQLSSESCSGETKRTVRKRKYSSASCTSVASSGDQPVAPTTESSTDLLDTKNRGRRSRSKGRGKQLLTNLDYSEKPIGIKAALRSNSHASLVEGIPYYSQSKSRSRSRSKSCDRQTLQSSEEPKASTSTSISARKVQKKLSTKGKAKSKIASKPESSTQRNLEQVPKKKSRFDPFPSNRVDPAGVSTAEVQKVKNKTSKSQKKDPSKDKASTAGLKKVARRNPAKNTGSCASSR